MPKKGEKWSPERRAAASAAAKARMGNVEGNTAVADKPIAAAIASYEQRPQRWKRPDDGFHYVLVEKKPTSLEIDYQGYKLEDFSDMELCPERSTRLHDVYRIPREIYLAKRKEKGDKSRKGAQAPVQADIRAEGGTITQNTASEAAQQRPEEFFGDKPESA